MLTKQDVRAEYPGKITTTQRNLSIAREAIKMLWNERLAERDMAQSEDRSGSCKFAALLSRDLFGGRLTGNYEHIFTRRDRKIIDLNADQMDVISLGALAHVHDRNHIEHADYRESLGCCQARVKRWVDWVLQNPNIERVPTAPDYEIQPSV